MKLWMWDERGKGFFPYHCKGAGWEKRCRNKSFFEKILCELSRCDDGGRGCVIPDSKQFAIGFTKIWGILFFLVGWKRDRLSSLALVTIKSLLQIQRISYIGITLPMPSLYRTLEPQIHNTKPLLWLFLAFTCLSVPCVICWCTADSGEIHREG